MACLKGVSSATGLNEGDLLKDAETHDEAAAAQEALGKASGQDTAEVEGKGSEEAGSLSTVKEGKETSGSHEQEGRAKSSKDEEMALEHDSVASQSKAEEEDEAGSSAADEAGQNNKDSKTSQKHHESDSGSSSTSDVDGPSSIPPLGEVIFAAAESLYDAYVELGFHLAETSDEKTRKVLEAAMESVMKAARKMKVVEKAGEEMMREREGEQGQPAESVKQPPTATRRSNPLVTQKVQPEGLSSSAQQDVNQLRDPPQELVSIPVSILPQPSPAADLATDSPKVPTAATAASERSQSHDSQRSPQNQRKVAKVELSGSYAVKKWDARNNLKDPGPKLYCVSSGDRGPAGKRSGASPPKELYDQASMLFNFAKHRSLYNASEEGKRVAFMMGLAHKPDQPRATMLRCMTTDKFKGKLEAREEGRKWSTQELREHRL